MADQIIECERCQRKYRVPGQLSGNAFRCRNCDHVIPIPDLTEKSPVRPGAFEEEPVPVQRESRTVRSEHRRPRRQLVREHLHTDPQSTGWVWHGLVALASAIITLFVVLGVQSLWRGTPSQEISTAKSESRPQPDSHQTFSESRADRTDSVASQNSHGSVVKSNDALPVQTPTPVTSSSSVASIGATPSFIGTPAIVAPIAATPLIPAPAVSAAQGTGSDSETVVMAPSGSQSGNAGGASSRNGGVPQPLAESGRTSQSALASETDKPGRYGKSGYSVEIPAGFVLEDVADEEGRFEAEWRAVDTSFDKQARLTFGLRFDPAVVAGSRPPVYAQGGVFIGGGGEMYIATGGRLENVSIGNATFFKLIYPQNPGEKKNKWVMMCHFDGVRVKFEGNSSAPAPDKLLASIAATFSSIDKNFSIPGLSAGTGFGAPQTASTSATSPSSAPKIPSEKSESLATAAMGEVQWGGSGGGRIIRLKESPGGSNSPAFSGSPPRFILDQREVMDAVTGNRIVELPSELEDGGRAISSDGKRVAHYADDHGHEVPVIQIYSCENPEAPPVRIENSEGTWRIGAMRFLDGNRLIVHTQSDGWIVWDSTTGKKLTTMEGPSPNGGGLTFSNDGKYMAVADHSSVMVFDTSRGRVIARMARVHKGRELNLFWCSGLAFSPDMQELAGLFSDGQFIVWSNKGEVVLEEILSGVGRGTGRNTSTVFYLPDKSGWFIDGNRLLDRQSMSFLWEIENAAWHDAYCAVLDQNTVMTTSGRGFGEELAFVEIPWEAIKAGQAKLDPGVKPLLTRGGSLSLQCNVAEVRFADPTQTRSSLTDAFQQRLALSEVSIAENQPVTMIVTYAEKSGGAKTVRSMLGRFGAGGSETVVEDTTITVSIEMRVEGRSEPIWKQEINEEIGLIVNADLTPQAFRNENFENVIQSIDRLNFPTRISGDGDSALPVRTSL